MNFHFGSAFLKSEQRSNQCKWKHLFGFTVSSEHCPTQTIIFSLFWLGRLSLQLTGVLSKHGTEPLSCLNHVKTSPTVCRRLKSSSLDKSMPRRWDERWLAERNDVTKTEHLTWKGDFRIVLLAMRLLRCSWPCCHQPGEESWPLWRHRGFIRQSSFDHYGPIWKVEQSK